MFKKMLMSSGLVLLLTGFVSCDSDPEKEAEWQIARIEKKEAQRLVTWHDLKNEPPMTEDEILLYIKILPEFARVAGVDPAGEMDFYRKHELTKNRFNYLGRKIEIASLLLAGVRLDLDRFPESARPNEAELEIVGGNSLELKWAQDECDEIRRKRKSLGGGG